MLELTIRLKGADEADIVLPIVQKMTLRDTHLVSIQRGFSVKWRVQGKAPREGSEIHESGRCM